MIKSGQSFLRDAQFCAVLAAYAGLALISHPPSILEGGGDKLLHFIANLALFASACLRSRPHQKLFPTWCLLFAFTCAVEFSQGLVPERNPDWRDVLANAGGLTLGLAIALILQKQGFFRRLNPE